MTFELSSPQRLGRTVVLGYCDIGAAGIRALEGLSAGTGADANGAGTAPRKGLRETGRESLEFSRMPGAVFNGLPALEAVHFDADSDGEGETYNNKSVTLLKLNTEVWHDLSASLAMALVDLLAEQKPAVERVVVAAAVQPPKRNQAPRPVVPSSSSTKGTPAAVIPPDCVCAFTSPGSRHNADADHTALLSPPGLLALPASARIADSFLTTLIRLCRLEEIPLLVLARLGYRATGAKADVDGTDEAIKDLGVCLSEVTGLEFDAEKACGVRWSKGWKGIRPAQGAVHGYI